MDQKTFNVVLYNSFYRSSWVLEKKAGEYAPGEDRLENFKEAGKLQDISPELALFGMMAKHLVSLSSMCRLIDLVTPSSAQEVWEEKLTDSINYLFLLEALVRERYGWPDPPVRT